MRMMIDMPEFACGDDTLERAFHLALGAFAINTRRISSGLVTEPRACLLAGPFLDLMTQHTNFSI